jgi:hypothetical protein
MWAICPFRAHAVRLQCRTAKGLDLSSPFDLHSAAVLDSHMPCHDHAVRLPCRAAKGLDFVAPI